MICNHGEGCGVGKWLEGSSSDKGYWEVHKSESAMSLIVKRNKSV